MFSSVRARSDMHVVMMQKLCAVEMSNAILQLSIIPQG